MGITKKELFPGRGYAYGDNNLIKYDSGPLELIDQKKQGVHGVFSYFGRYTILTPHFNSDEWRGKQKLFDLSTRELIDIQTFIWPFVRKCNK